MTLPFKPGRLVCLPVIALLLALMPEVVQPQRVAAQVGAAVNVCGTLNGYTAAGALLPGTISVGSTTLPIAAGTNISGAGSLATGSNVCLQGSLNALGQLASGSLTANVTAGGGTGTGTGVGVGTGTGTGTGVGVGTGTGTGTGVGVGTGTGTGTGVGVGTGTGTGATGTGTGTGGTTVGSGTGTTPRATVGANVNVCGTVNLYRADTATTAGLLSIDGQSFTIAPGTTLSGSNLLTASTNPSVCFQGTLNAAGQVNTGNITASTVSAGANGAVNVCGNVSNYTAATTSTPGSITIANQVIPIAANALLSGAAQAAAGANLCLNGSTNAAGQLQNGTLTAQGQAALDVCGTVTAYQPATASAPGSVTIGGQLVSIASGANIAGANLLTTNANVCFHGNLNGAGQVNSGNVTGSTVNAGGSASFTICGTVSSYTAATTGGPGSITINSQTIPIAAGTTLSGDALATNGADVCLTGTRDVSGQLKDGQFTASTTGRIDICGKVAAYQAATASTAGSLSINGETLTIAPGATLTGKNLLTASVNPDVCANLSFNGAGQVNAGNITASTVSANGSATIDVCGTLSNYTPATAAAPGSITLAGQQIPIAAGAVINGFASVATGTKVCLDGTANASGQLKDGTLTTQANVNLCGTVTAYQAATATAPGSITIAGVTFGIKPGASLTPSGQDVKVNVGSYCLNATQDASNLITTGVISGSVPLAITVCGLVSAYTAPTATGPGSVTIAGVTFPIAAGTSANGSISVGTNECLALTFANTSQGSGGSPGGGSSNGAAGSSQPPATAISAGPNPGGATSLRGPFTNYAPPTATTPGSVTTRGATFTIEAGTNLTVSGSLPLAATPYTSAVHHGRGGPVIE